MTASNALALAHEIEDQALNVAKSVEDPKLNEIIRWTSYQGDGDDEITIELTMYAPSKFFGVARVSNNNLIGRVKVDLAKEEAKILSIECDRRAQ